MHDFITCPPSACLANMPRPQLSPPCSRASATLVSKRWHRVFHASGSLWRHVDVSEPRDLDVSQRESWLAAKLRQLRRVAPAVESIDLCDTAGMDVLPDVLQCLHPGVLRAVDAGEYGPPVTESAMRALQHLAGLTRISLGMDGRAPANCSWALSQLASLQDLWLEFAPLPADCPAAIAGLTGLKALTLFSSQPLPDVQPLTALSGLTYLILQEDGPSAGLLVLPAGQFPYIHSATYYSPVLKVRLGIQPPQPHGAFVAAQCGVATASSALLCRLAKRASLLVPTSLARCNCPARLPAGSSA